MRAASTRLERLAVRALACAVFTLPLAGCGGDDDDEPSSPPPKTKPAPMPGWKAAVGDGGILLETFDDASWEARKIVDRDLYAVSCIDNEVGWAVGSRGFIGHTRDAGWSWPAQDSGVTSTLRAVSFAFDDQLREVGLAVGDDGTLLTTHDGGDHWLQHELGTDQTLRGSAIGEDGALLVAVGDGGVVQRSADGGMTFETLRIDGASDLFDVALDAKGQTALAVDAAGVVYRSRDGARTFERFHTVAGALESVSLGRRGELASVAGPAGAWLLGADGWRELALGGSATLHATLVAPREDRAYFAGDAGTLIEAGADGALLPVRSSANATLRGIEDLEAR